MVYHASQTKNKIRESQITFERLTLLDSTIDYLAQYRLVDRSRLEMFGRAFTLEDEDEDGVISYEVSRLFYSGLTL